MIKCICKIFVHLHNICTLVFVKQFYDINGDELTIQIFLYTQPINLVGKVERLNECGEHKITISKP